MSEMEEKNEDLTPEQQFAQFYNTFISYIKYGRWFFGILTAVVLLIISGLGYYFVEKIEQLTANTNNIGNVKESIAGLGEKISGLSDKITTMDDGVSGHIEKVDTAQNATTETLTALKVDIATLNTVVDRVGKSEAAITASGEKAAELQTKVSESFTSLKTATENLQKEVVGKTEAVNTALATALETIKSHELKIAELESAIAVKVATAIQKSKQQETVTGNRFVLSTTDVQVETPIVLRKEKAIDVTNLSTDQLVNVTDIRILIPNERKPPEEYSLRGTVDENGTLLVHISHKAPGNFVKLLQEAKYIIVYVAFETS